MTPTHPVDPPIPPHVTALVDAIPAEDTADAIIRRAQEIGVLVITRENAALMRSLMDGSARRATTTTDRLMALNASDHEHVIPFDCDHTVDCCSVCHDYTGGAA